MPGLDRYEARKQIVADLQKRRCYLVKIENYNHNPSVIAVTVAAFHGCRADCVKSSGL